MSSSQPSYKVRHCILSNHQSFFPVANGDAHHPSNLHTLIPLILRRCIEHRELPPAVAIQRQYRCCVPAPIAIVWGRPDGDELVVEHVLEAFLNQLVRARDERQ